MRSSGAKILSAATERTLQRIRAIVMAVPIRDDFGLLGFPAINACRARWLARRDEMRRMHALVDGAELCDALLAELDAAVAESSDEALSLQQAAAESGYSADHL